MTIVACAVLMARLAAPQPQADAAPPDTTRIQAALNLCGPGRAVVLKSDGRHASFESAPLILPRGVTLFIGQGVTLYGSRNPRDYDLAGSRKAAVRKPFLFAYQAAFSGVSGSGTINGQGIAPELVSSYESQGFQIAGVTLRNAAGIAAAIHKTIGLKVSGIRIDSLAASVGLLLSNAQDASVTGAWIRVAGEAIVLKASILGATSQVAIRDVDIAGGRGIGIGDDTYGAVRSVTFDGIAVDGARTAFHFNLKGTEGGKPRDIRASNVCLHDVAAPLEALPAGRNLDFGGISTVCAIPALPPAALTADIALTPGIGRARSVVVRPGASIQKAVDTLPAQGGEIRVMPGTYREVVTIRKPHVHLHGEDSDPSRTVIVYGNGPPQGGTFASATVFVEAPDVTIDHLSIVNDLGVGKGQGVALAVTADRAIFRHLRILGAQDTLFAASHYCYGDYGPCVAARQYFADCYIEGNTDFIFGDSAAVFERSELHGIFERQRDVHRAEQAHRGAARQRLCLRPLPAHGRAAPGPDFARPSMAPLRDSRVPARADRSAGHSGRLDGVDPLRQAEPAHCVLCRVRVVGAGGEPKGPRAVFAPAHGGGSRTVGRAPLPCGRRRLESGEDRR